MTSIPISDRFFFAYLHCKYKAFLSLSGKNGRKSEIEILQDRNHAEYRKRVRDHLSATGDNTATIPLNSSFSEVKKQKLRIAIDVSISNDKYSLTIDAIELAARPAPRKPVYNPIIFLPQQKMNKKHKLLLAFYGTALGCEQNMEPSSGRIIFGSNLSSRKVQLTTMDKTVTSIEKEITRMAEMKNPPPLRLNDHCKICEFWDICYSAAKEKDDLSLLKGLSEKEIASLNKRGIFTVTQYSYTFRPRRAKKFAENSIIRHQHSLNALAIRTQTIYVAGRLEVPSGTRRIYLDVEGIPDNNFYYLIGLVIDDGANVTEHSFWAKDQSEEKTIWKSFTEIMRSMNDFVMFHYGSYETQFVRDMEKAYGCDTETIDKIRSRSVNVLSIIYGRIYFPTYSNDLKSIASCLGFKWSADDATGLNSILWRHEWEATGETILKQKLLEYNRNDCMGLRTIVENIISLSGERVNQATKGFLTKNVDEIEEEKPFGIFKLNNFCFPELENINRCAYFDYQRDKIYARTNPRRRKVIKKEIHKHKMRFRINQIIKVRRSKKCPQCGTSYPYRHANYSRIVYDIKMSDSGIRRWVVKYAYSRFRCKECNKTFVPTSYRAFTASKYGPNLMAWVIYQHIGRLKPQHSILEDVKEIFKYHFPITVVGDFKGRAATFCKEACDELWSTLLSGTLLHVDETKVSVRGVTNYVWAFASVTSVYYMHTKTREGEFLKEKIRGFNGVLVSDFYAAYDSIQCTQQKCLIHPRHER